MTIKTIEKMTFDELNAWLVERDLAAYNRGTTPKDRIYFITEATARWAAAQVKPAPQRKRVIPTEAAQRATAREALAHNAEAFYNK